MAGPLRYIGETVPIKAEFLLDDIGVTGIGPIVSIRRLSDGNYLQNGGGSFGATFASNAMTEIDNINERGIYIYNFNQAVDTTLVQQNYLVKVSGFVNTQSRFMSQVISFDKSFEQLIRDASGTLEAEHNITQASLATFSGEALVDLDQIKGVGFSSGDSLDAISAAISGLTSSSDAALILALSGTLIDEHNDTQNRIVLTSGAIISEINNGVLPTGLIQIELDCGI